MLGAADVRVAVLLADGRSEVPPDLDPMPDPVGSIELTAAELAVAAGAGAVRPPAPS